MPDRVIAAKRANALVEDATADLRALRDLLPHLEAVEGVHVTVHRGLVTNIIVVRTARSVLKLRCYGAAAFADQIRAARPLG